MKWVALKFFAFLSLLIFLVGCDLREPTAGEQAAPQLKLQGSYPLEVPEPSGLALHPDGQSLWTVSDQTNRVYRINLSGGILEALDYRGTDLEGVTYDSSCKCLWVAEERSRELVKLDLSGNELERHRILEGMDNSGLEGLCLTTDHCLAVVKEKNPGLFLVLNPDFSVKRQIALDFARDYSGLWPDTVAQRYWIVSDEEKTLYLWEENNGVVERYFLGINKAEGIAIDWRKNRIYVVSDSESKLYVFLM